MPCPHSQRLSSSAAGWTDEEEESEESALYRRRQKLQRGTVGRDFFFKLIRTRQRYMWVRQEGNPSHTKPNSFCPVGDINH